MFGSLGMILCNELSKCYRRRFLLFLLFGHLSIQAILLYVSSLPPSSVWVRVLVDFLPCTDLCEMRCPS